MPTYNEETQHVRTPNLMDTPYAVAGIVIGCVVALWLIRRGFRGVGLPGVGNVSLGK